MNTDAEKIQAYEMARAFAYKKAAGRNWGDDRTEQVISELTASLMTAMSKEGFKMAFVWNHLNLYWPTAMAKVFGQQIIHHGRGTTALAVKIRKLRAQGLEDDAIREKLPMTDYTWKRCLFYLDDEKHVCMWNEDGEQMEIRDDTQDETPQIDAKEQVEALLAKLPDRHAEAVRLHYLEGWNMRQIAELQGVTYQRVQQMIDKSLVRLRTNRSFLHMTRPEPEPAPKKKKKRKA